MKQTETIFLVLGLLLGGIWSVGHCLDTPQIHAASATAGVQPESPPSASSNPVVVEIDGRPFTTEDLRMWADFDRRPMRERKDLDASIDRMLNDTLMAEEARKTEGFESRPGLWAKRMARSGELWRDWYWSTQVQHRLVVTDEEVYAAIPPQEPVATLRQLIVADAEKAEQLRQQVLSGQEDFEAAIRENSQGMSRDRGGLVDMVRPTAPQYPAEVLQAVFSGKPGDYSRVFSLPIGFLFFRIEELKSSEDVVKEVFPSYKKQVTDRKSRELWDQALGELVAKHKVEVVDETVARFNEAVEKKAPIGPLLKDVLARVDGNAILLGDVVDPTGGGVIHGGSSADSLLQKAVENYALRQEVQRLGASNPVIERRERFALNALLAREYISFRAEGVSVTDQDVQAYYEANRELFKTPLLYRYSVIETHSEDRLKEIYKALAAGKSFDDVAQKWSDHQSGKTGGDIGFLDPRAIAPEHQRLASLEVGQYLKEPIEFRRDDLPYPVFVVAKKTGVQEPGYRELDPALAQTIATRLFARRRGAIAGQILAELKAARKVTVHSEALDRYFAALDKTAQPRPTGGPPPAHGGRLPFGSQPDAPTKTPTPEGGPR